MVYAAACSVQTNAWFEFDADLFCCHSLGSVYISSLKTSLCFLRFAFMTKSGVTDGNKYECPRRMLLI